MLVSGKILLPKRNLAGTNGYLARKNGNPAEKMVTGWKNHVPFLHSSFELFADFLSFFQEILLEDLRLETLSATN